MNVLVIGENIDKIVGELKRDRHEVYALHPDEDERVLLRRETIHAALLNNLSNGEVIQKSLALAGANIQVFLTLDKLKSFMATHSFLQCA